MTYNKSLQLTPEPLAVSEETRLFGQPLVGRCGGATELYVLRLQLRMPPAIDKGFLCFVNACPKQNVGIPSLEVSFASALPKIL
jgi:hypothetical protein